MVWFILVLITCIVLVVSAFREKNRLVKKRPTVEWTWDSYNYMGGSHNAGSKLIGAGVIFALWLGVSMVATGAVYGDHLWVKNSATILEEYSAQRDILLAEFSDVLSSEDFVQLMNAAVPEDLLFLATIPHVSDFMLGRAQKIVDVNKTYFKLRNDLMYKSRGICNATQNPFHIVWFQVVPCDLNRVAVLTS